jgi:hypothetical protein
MARLLRAVVLFAWSLLGVSYADCRSIAPLVPVNYPRDRPALDLDEIVLRPANRDHYTEFYLFRNSPQLTELAFHKHVEDREGC